MKSNYFIERLVCPACNSDSHLSLLSLNYTDSPLKDYLYNFYNPQGCIESEYLEGAKYILDECNHCGLIYQRYIPNETLMLRLYEKWINPDLVYQLYEQSYPYSYYLNYASVVDAMIRYFEKIPAEIKVFDYAMGWGNWALMAKAFGCQVYGSELSPRRIDHAKALGIKIIQWDDIPNYEFDFINTDQVFEHIAEPLTTLNHLKQALAAKGIIRISVPNGSDIKTRLTIQDWTSNKSSPNSLNAIAPLEHINCFNSDSLLMMGDLAGLNPIQFTYTLNNELLIKNSPIAQFKIFLKNIKWLIKSMLPSRKFLNNNIDIYFKKRNN